MDWFKRRAASSQTHSKTKKKASAEKVRYYVRPSDHRVVQAHKKESGHGYVYHKRTNSGTRNVPVTGSTFSSEKLAREKANRLKAKS